LPSFRNQVIHEMLLVVILRQGLRAYGPSFHVVHYAILPDHLHLVVEADDGPTLAPASRRKNPLRSGVSGLMIAFARRLNKLLGISGKVWDDRYHRHDLKTPREVKYSLRYVLSNARKHGILDHSRYDYDPYSSALGFTGWSRPLRVIEEDGPIFFGGDPRTWLLGRGWLLRGPIDPDEVPGPRLPTA
jgi:hypothetical protein